MVAVPFLLSCSLVGAVAAFVGKKGNVLRGIVFVIEVIKPPLAGKENGASPKLKLELANAELVKGRFVTRLAVFV